MILLAAFLAFTLGLVQFFSEEIVKTCGKYYDHVLSFSAGISVTYIFVHFFPHFSYDLVKKDEFLFVSVLLLYLYPSY